MGGVISSNFSHLKVHSYYTLLGATASPQALVQRAVAEGYTTLALTDTNVLYGAVAFQTACLAAGIRPIIGLTLTVAPPKLAQSQLILLAKNEVGYRSLCRLSSALQAYPDRTERIAAGLSWATLAENRAGLLAIDAGRQGSIAQSLVKGNEAAVKHFLAHFGGIFGENGFVGIEVNGQMQSNQRVERSLHLAGRFGLAAVALQPVYCLDSAEKSHFPLLAAIDHNQPIDAVQPAWLPDAGDPEQPLHFFSSAEMQTRFAHYPDLLDTISTVTDQCQLALPDGKPIWPVLNLKKAQTTLAELTQQAQDGAIKKYPLPLAQVIQARLTHELDLIGTFGFAPLFLVVADVVAFALSAEIPLSTRGSVANSLVAYCVGITSVDPIEHDLLFERFLNPARKSLPDIDLDFCSRRRDEVLDYVRQRYGRDKVAAVATINHFKQKSAVRETAKAFGYAKREIDVLMKRLPRGWHPDPQRRKSQTLLELAAELDNPRDRATITQAAIILGLPHHLSVHPGGTVITPAALTDIVPLQWANKGFVTTQFDHRDVERIGLPKLDLLGIRALTVQADAAALVCKFYDPDFSLSQINQTDPATANAIQHGDTIGVFQCESAGAQRTLKQLKAHTLRDLAIANAFFKPGPATGGMAKTFVRRYRGEAPVSYLHPTLEPILATTKGVMLFQEQILRVAREIAGLSWQQANQLRKGISKFDASGMRALQNEFVTGCQRKAVGLSARQAEILWTQVMAFAGYGFNQGHATAYAAVSYKAAWLKTHYPAPFLTARLANGGGYYYPSVYVAEARRLGMQVNPPHINHSGVAFVMALDESQVTLWMGLGGVRSLRHKSVQAIIAQRPFYDLRDLLARVPLQKKEVRHLIQCGALDGLGKSRNSLLAQAEGHARGRPIQQMMLPFLGEGEISAETAQDRLEWETRILGIPLSIHPIQLVAPASRTPIGTMQPQLGQKLQLYGQRLPDWDRNSFLLADASGLLRIHTPKSLAAQLTKPKSNALVHVSAIWARDEWQNIRTEAHAITLV